MKRAGRKSRETKHKRVCFVIMPFSKTTKKHDGKYWTRHYREFLKPIIEGTSEFEAQRSRPLRGGVLDQIVLSCVTAPAVLADITDWNANVFWELGIRHSFKHGTIIVAQEGTRVPFDVSMQGVLFYKSEDYINNEFREGVGDALKECCLKDCRPDSHVLEALGGRGSLFEIFRRDEAIRRLGAIALECRMNIVTLQGIQEIIRDRKKDESLGGANAKMQTRALEVLHSERYVDDADELYKNAMLLMMLLESANVAISRWETKQVGIDNWIEKHKETLYKLLVETGQAAEKKIGELKTKA